MEIKVPQKNFSVKETLVLQPKLKEIAEAYLYRKLQAEILKEKIFTD